MNLAVHSRAIAPCTLRVHLRAYALRRMNVWSEKTTVCRIFNCKRAKLFNLMIQLACRASWTKDARPFRPGLARRTRAPHVEKPSGEYRARTGDLLVANQALSQLS
jgi:hypothetical protein